MLSLPCRGRVSARPRFLFALVLAIPMPAVGATATTPPAAPAIPVPRAVVRETRYDFGRVKLGQKIVHAFAVHNAGNATLEFRGAELSVKGMTCRVSRPLPASADGTISIEWDTSHIQGKLRGEATIRTNDPAIPSISLELSGEVFGPLEIEPIPAVFLSVFRDEEVHRELTLRNNQDSPSTIRLLEPGITHFSATLSPVESGRVWKLTVRAVPQTPPGRYEETLELESEDAAIGRVRLPVHLFVKTDLYANPGELDFGDVPLERLRRDPKALQLLGQNFFVKRREGAFRLLGVRSDVGALDLRTSPNEGASNSFQIDVALRQDLLRPGSLEGTIWVDTDDPKFPHVSIRVRGRVI